MDLVKKIFGSGSDTFIGTAGADILYGGDGGDNLRGGKGDDQIYGQGGGDVLSGDLGFDRIWGGDGSDSIRTTSPEYDIARGGAGNDKIVALNDLVFGGLGRDALIANVFSAGARITEPSLTTLNGGEDLDLFTVATRPTGFSDTIVITDFAKGESLLLLAEGGLAPGSLSISTSMDGHAVALVAGSPAVTQALQGTDLVLSFNGSDHDQVILRGVGDWLHF
jgi:Ca2+-binding RTX toxin-like protein